MFLRLLDRLEEILVSVLMVTAVVIIFVAVCQRYSVGLLADLVSWARSNDHAIILEYSRSVYRSMAGINLLWAQELCIYLFVWMAKFGAAYGVRLGIHVGVDVLANAVSPAWRKILTIIAIVAGVIFTAIIAWIGGSFVWDIYKTGSVSADLEMPMWIVYLAVPAGSALMCFRFLQTLFRYLESGELPHHSHAPIDEDEHAPSPAEPKGVQA